MGLYCVTMPVLNELSAKREYAVVIAKLPS